VTAASRTLGEAVAEVANLLRASGIDEPRREARLLLGRSLALDPAAVLGMPERRLSEAERRRVENVAARRAAREPVSRIFGTREFWSLEFRLSPETLDPRPDSETLIEAALEALAPDKPQRILDLGTGTGCLLLAVLSERKQAVGVGVDRALGAVTVARGNAARLGFADRASFFVGSWGAALAGPFDLVLANPPYIASAAIATLAPEVSRYEPRLALDGGADGLEAYRVLAPDLARVLHRGGIAALEMGEGQGDEIASILRKAGLQTAARRRDLAGRDRCLIATRTA
jgi:release factor glutamine methyltransferase